MPVVDLRFTKLEAKREVAPKSPKFEKGIKINNNSKIKKITKKKLPGLGEAVVVDFEYNTKYEPKIGSINVEGSLIFHEKDMSEHVTTEKGKVMLKGMAYVEVQNSILGASSIQALMLAKELRLPPPIQLPAVIAEESGKSKKGYA